MKCLLFSPPLAHLWCNDVTIRAPYFCLCPAMHWSSRHYMMMDQMHPWFFYCLSSLKIRQQLSNNHHISKHHKKYFQETSCIISPFCVKLEQLDTTSAVIQSKVWIHVCYQSRHFELFQKILNKFLLSCVFLNVHWKDWASPEIMKKSNESVQ